MASASDGSTGRRPTAALSEDGLDLLERLPAEKGLSAERDPAIPTGANLSSAMSSSPGPSVG